MKSFRYDFISDATSFFSLFVRVASFSDLCVVTCDDDDVIADCEGRKQGDSEMLLMMKSEDDKHDVMKIKSLLNSFRGEFQFSWFSAES